MDGDGDRSVNGTYTESIANGVAGGRYHFSLSLLLGFSCGRYLYISDTNGQSYKELNPMSVCLWLVTEE